MVATDHTHSDLGGGDVKKSADNTFSGINTFTNANAVKMVTDSDTTQILFEEDGDPSTNAAINWSVNSTFGDIEGEMKIRSHVFTIENENNVDALQFDGSVGTFSAPPVCSVAATSDNQLVNKSYVDTNSVSLSAANTFTGTKTVFDNKVGIGTSTVSRTLNIHQTNTPGIQITNAASSGTAAGNGFEIIQNGNNSIIANRENGYMAYHTNNTERMRITNSGRIGIGLTSPNTNFIMDVNGNIRVVGHIRANYGTSSFHQSVFGVNSIGSPTNFADQAYFGHIDQTSTGTYGNYAVVQNSVGESFFNSAAGKLIYFRFNNVTSRTLNSNGNFGSSDDRLKTDEQCITNATDTIMKLSPQIYKKYLTKDFSDDYGIQSGFIAQDIWYNAPELRHLVFPGHDASGNRVTPHELPDGVDTLQDIQDDLDYNALGWGETEVGVDYEQIIAYLVGSIQEQQTLIETEQAKTASLETQVASLLERVAALET